MLKNLNLHHQLFHLGNNHHLGKGPAPRPTPPWPRCICHHRSGLTIVSTTSTTDDAHSYPLWNERLHIREPSHAAGYSLMSAREGTATRHLIRCMLHAGVKVSLSDFSYGPVGYEHFLSYRLRDQEGRGNGIVNLCVRRLRGNGEDQFNGGGTHAMGYPVAPVVGYDNGYSAYKKY